MDAKVAALKYEQQEKANLSDALSHVQSELKALQELHATSTGTHSSTQSNSTSRNKEEKKTERRVAKAKLIVDEINLCPDPSNRSRKHCDQRENETGCRCCVCVGHR